MTQETKKVFSAAAVAAILGLKNQKINTQDTPALYQHDNMGTRLRVQDSGNDGAA